MGVRKMKTIVIIEDEFRIREGIAKLIMRLDSNFSVKGEAEDGLEGLRLIQDLQPDVAITDIRMPKIDGLEMIAQAKKVSPDTVFVILSGYADFSYAQTAMRLGVQEYLLKPATISDVRSLLERLDSKEEVSDQSDSEGVCLPDTGDRSPVVEKAIDILNKDYARPIRLESVADRLKITPQYLSNMFTRETGMTFSSYLRKIRMGKAKELLKEGNMKIYEVAVAVGYPDQKYFSRVFHEYTGRSARDYYHNPEEIAREANGNGEEGVL